MQRIIHKTQAGETFVFDYDNSQTSSFDLLNQELLDKANDPNVNFDAIDAAEVAFKYGQNLLKEFGE